MTAQEWYEQGNAFRKESKWHEAINCYIQAIELDPDSPAVEAKRMLDDIMAFYCKDMYNPWFFAMQKIRCYIVIWLMLVPTLVLADVGTLYDKADSLYNAQL